MSPKQKKSGRDKIDVGDKVKHPEFGSGTVLHKVGEGENAKLTVAFETAGQKKLLAKYANLTRDKVDKSEKDEQLLGKTLLDAAAEKEKEEEVEEIGDEIVDEDEDDDEWDDEEEEMYDDDDDDDTPKPPKKK